MPSPALSIVGPAGLEVEADPALLAAGWQRRFVAGPERAEEAIELYTGMGYEVRAEKLTADSFGSGCSHCASTICREYVLIYTRSRKDGQT